jgi:hypothetical protein
MCCSLQLPILREERFDVNLYKNSVRTSQETYHVSATKPNRLMLVGETAVVYCENHTEHTNKSCVRNAEF